MGCDRVAPWTWPFPQEQVQAVSHELRGWAARENVALDTEHVVASQLRWWAFELPG
jgi:hypothetical protein